jgi:hypothetical protein
MQIGHCLSCYKFAANPVPLSGHCTFTRKAGNYFPEFSAFFPILQINRRCGPFHAISNRTSFAGEIYRDRLNFRIIPKANQFFDAIIETHTEGNTHVSSGGRIARFRECDTQVLFAAVQEYGPLNAEQDDIPGGRTSGVTFQLAEQIR